MDKKLLREKFKALRESLSERQWLKYSQKICQNLIESPFFKESRKIAFYYPVNKEVNLLSVMEEALKEGKEIFLPITYIRGKRITFHRVLNLEELSPGAFGIPEPPPINPQLDSLSLELILVPGLAFDLQKFRLGYGSGFYDRFLKETGARKIGVAFSFQVIERLPHDPWDVKMNYILTEKGFF